MTAEQQPHENQWDNRLIWSLEELLAWVRKYHMEQIDIRDHIDLLLGKYRNELDERQNEQPPVPSSTEPGQQPEYIVDEYTLGEIERLLNMPEHAWDESDYDAQNVALKSIRSRPYRQSPPVSHSECYKTGLAEGEAKAFSDANEWGERFGDDMIPGFVRARITHLERERTELPPVLPPEVSTCNHSACRVYGPCIDAYEDGEAPPCAKYQSKQWNAALLAKAREEWEETDHVWMTPEEEEKRIRADEAKAEERERVLGALLGKTKTLQEELAKGVWNDDSYNHESFEAGFDAVILEIQDDFIEALRHPAPQGEKENGD